MTALRTPFQSKKCCNCCNYKLFQQDYHKQRQNNLGMFAFCKKKKKKTCFHSVDWFMGWLIGDAEFNRFGSFLLITIRKWKKTLWTSWLLLRLLVWNRTNSPLVLATTAWRCHRWSDICLTWPSWRHSQPGGWQWVTNYYQTRLMVLLAIEVYAKQRPWNHEKISHLKQSERNLLTSD